MNWLELRSTVPVIQALQAGAQDVQQKELDKARKALARGESPEQVMEQMAHALTQKYLHGTLAALHKSEQTERQQLMGWLPRLFPSRDGRR